jgi:hypothetical protein
MVWRVLLVVAYGVAFGTLMALDNRGDGVTDALLIAVWAAAPVVGFLVGRWWAVFAVVGLLVGRTIGWEPGEHDGTPGLWAPAVVSMLVIVGGPLLLGAWLYRLYAKTSRSRRFWGSV